MKFPREHNKNPLTVESLLKFMDQVFADRSRSKTKNGALKEVLGSAQAVKCSIKAGFIDSITKCYSPKEVTKAVKEGKDAFAKLLEIDDNVIDQYFE